jgi:hypothetical protein
MSAGGRRSRLLAVWLVLSGLLVVIVVLERTDLIGAGRGGPGPAPHDARLLLPVPVEQLGAIEVGHARTLHRFERDAAGLWLYHGAHGGSDGPHTHQADPSMAERIEAAWAAFGRARVERRFALEGDAAAYGLDAPQMLILVYRPHDQQPLAQYAVGDIAPDELSRYVLVVGRSAVVTIPNYQIDNVLALIDAARTSPESLPDGRQGLVSGQ